MRLEKHVIVCYHESEYGEYTYLFSGRNCLFLGAWCLNNLQITEYAIEMLKKLGHEVYKKKLQDHFDTEDDMLLFLRDYHGCAV